MRYKLLGRVNTLGDVKKIYSLGCVGLRRIRSNYHAKDVTSMKGKVGPSVRGVVSLRPSTVVLSPFRGDNKCKQIRGLGVPVVRYTSCVRASTLKHTR